MAANTIREPNIKKLLCDNLNIRETFGRSKSKKLGYFFIPLKSVMPAHELEPPVNLLQI